MTLPTWATEKAREIVSHAWRVPVAAALVEAERRGAERMRESVSDAVRKECTACNGTGYDPRSKPETPGFECKYCGRPMDVIRALPLDEESES